MNKQSVNTFIKGMNQDIDKSLISKDSYLEAYNFRLVTSDGGSSGAFENIKGNKLISENLLTGEDSIVAGNNYLVVLGTINYNSVDYSNGDVFVGVGGVGAFTGIGKVLDLSNSEQLPEGQLICGAGRIRDYLILFTTNNTDTAPDGGNSMIWKLELDIKNEKVDSLTKLYDDNLNNSTGTLNFSTANKIKMVSKYETSSIQKGYWTDTYNNIRYADFSKNLTVTGEAYTADNYMSPEMFEFLPLFTPSKPTLSSIVSGHLMSGMVQYSYQLYRLNGASTVFSPVSDIYHVVNDNDFLSNTLNYRGDFESTETGKGFKISVTNNNYGYDRLRLVRIHYPAFGAVPTISIANEIEISVSPSTVDITDIGDTINSLTLDEFNISSTELFKCEDLAIKDNRLFAANIEKSEFDIGDFDCRAIRYRNWYDPIDMVHRVNTTSTSRTVYDYLTNVTFSYSSNNTIYVQINNLSSFLGLTSPDAITNVTAVNSTHSTGQVIAGSYTNSLGPGEFYGATLSEINFSGVSYNAVLDRLTFNVTKTTGNFFTDFVALEVSYMMGFIVTYDWDDYNNTVDALLEDSDPLLNTTITVPVTDDLDGWIDAGWDTYVDTHDGINIFNNPDNDGDDEHAYKYQSNGITVGAEGLNVKIDFVTDDFILDTSNDNKTFFVTAPTDSTDLSYKNYASPWKDGKLSWQRDEVYRLEAVFGNTRGQVSEPHWIIDLRMPSLHDVDFLNSDGSTVSPSILSKIDGTTIKSYSLRPRIYFKNFPEGAEWVQIYRVKREREDRSVVTQGYVIPSYFDDTTYRPNTADSSILTNEEIIKLVSPEINITKNISFKSADYLEYVTNFATHSTSTAETTITMSTCGYTHKMKQNTRVAFSNNCISDIVEAESVIPLSSSTDSGTSINSINYSNYYNSHDSKGCSGLLIAYSNGSWSAESVSNVIANYRANVYGSQYGGYTYEDRALNVSIPCSDIITSTGTWNTIEYGDTFINYFDVSTMLTDLSKSTTTIYDVWTETVFVPLESSINCDLRHDLESRHMSPASYGTSFITAHYLRQEYMGNHSFGLYSFNQTKDLYLYNTVYSQQTSAQYAISSMLDTPEEIEFDCLVKASNVKYSGELSDSWTKFNANEEIEVDSNYGEIKAISTINDKLLFWQSDAFGMLSVNSRSLIQDNISSQLVLGSGGILDRYDYISNTIGMYDKDSLINSDSSVYWFYDKDVSLYKFDSSLSNLTKDKGMWSWFKNNWSTDYSIHGVYNRKYNEVIYSLYKYSDQTGYTIAYNEQTSQFMSFYNHVPYMYIDYKYGYLSTIRSDDDNYSFIFMHDSDINPRCRFYSLVNYLDDDESNTYDSTVKLIHNENYNTTKVYDNVFFISNAFDSDNIDLYNITIDKIRCYNDYQNTDWVDLVYNNNIMRRERGWTLAIPRNLVTGDYTSSPDIFTEISETKDYFERIRDKYMVVDLLFDNTNNVKFVIPFLGINYRISYR